jgi:acyl-Coa thioesterase superfamily protein/acyl-CoA thioesterase superfamily protein
VCAAFYSPDGDRFVSHDVTRGPWDADAQHAGPPAALLGRALERCEPRPDAQIARVTFEILGPVPLAPLQTSARVVRPGRSVELLEGTLSGPDGPAMRASAWRLRTAPVELDPAGAVAEEPPPGPEDAEERDFFPTGSDVGYHTAMDYRFVRGAFLELGPATVWMRMRQPLVAGEEPTPLQRLLAVADTGNGVSAVLDYHRFLFINVELTVHVLRPPDGEWVCLDAVTHAGEHGVGLTRTALWDERGRVGAAAQSLLLRAR